MRRHSKASGPSSQRAPRPKVHGTIPTAPECALIYTIPPTDDNACWTGSPLLTVADVANHLSVSHDVVRNLLGKEKLRGTKVGGQWRIWAEDLAKYVMSTFEKS